MDPDGRADDSKRAVFRRITESPYYRIPAIEYTAPISVHSNTMFTDSPARGSNYISNASITWLRRFGSSILLLSGNVSTISDAMGSPYGTVDLRFQSMSERFTRILGIKGFQTTTYGELR